MQYDQCYRCNMGFRIESALTRAADRTRCHDCGIRFWWALADPGNVIKVGMAPSDYEIFLKNRGRRLCGQ